MKIIVILFIFAINVNALFTQFDQSHQTPQFQDLEEGLVAYYPFNGNANDESGNGHHGIVNGATLTTDRFGRSNTAYEFDGENDFIQLPANDHLALDFPISTSVWVSLSSDFGSFDNGIFDTDFVQDNYHGVMLNVSPGAFHQVFGDGSGCTCPTARRGVIHNTSWNLERFYSMIAVFENAHTFSLYLDGDLVSTDVWGEGGTEIAYSNSGGVIGVTDTNTSISTLNYFRGKIDDLRIYNRILSQEEIELLSNPNCSSYTTTLNYKFTTDTSIYALQQVALEDIQCSPSSSVIIQSPNVPMDGVLKVLQGAQLTIIAEQGCGSE